MRSSIPDDVATVVRDAAAAVPPYAASLETVQGRVTARRRRQVAGGSLLSVLAVAAAIAVPYALARPAAPTVLVPVPAASDPAPPPSQRLFLRYSTVIAVAGVAGSDTWEDMPALDPSKPNFGYPEGSTGVVSLGGLKELLPDGTLVTHTAGGDLVLPDGRSVALYPKDLAPGVARTDGPCVSDLAIMLEVRDPSGTPTVARDVREMCRVVSLAGATADEVYLVRGAPDASTGARLVAHRFADGSERGVAGLDALGGVVGDLNLAAGVAASVEGCRLAAVALASGQTVADLDLSAVDHCALVRLSPDGRRGAVTVEKFFDGGQREGWIRIVDLATGSVLVSEQIYASDDSARKFAPKGFGGLAWVDDEHVQVAYVEPPDETRLVAIDEVVRSATFHVP